MRFITALSGILTIICLASGTAMGGGEPIGDPHPKVFIRNAGQWPAAVHYGLLGAGAKAALTDEGIDLFALTSSLNLPAEIIGPQPEENAITLAHTRLRFVRPSPQMRIVEGEEADTRMQFYHGRDASGWYENVGTVHTVTYENVWENIDLEYRYDGKHLRQHIHVQPGGNPEDIAFVVEGAESPETILRAPLRAGSQSQDMPMEIRVDTLRPRPGPDLISWRQLVETEFSTYFGGSERDHPFDIEVDEHSNMFLFLLTMSDDLPLRNEMQSVIKGSDDWYLAKLSCDGNTLLFGTYFGGDRTEWQSPTNSFSSINGGRLHLASDGDILAHTQTNDESFPLTSSAVQTKLCQITIPYFNNDVILRFTSSGTLRASTLFEGPTYSYIQDFETGPGGDVYILGLANGVQWFVTPGGVIHPNLVVREHTDCIFCYSTSYIARLSPNLDTLRWGTYFLNSNGDNRTLLLPCSNLAMVSPGMAGHMDMEIDGEGNVVVTGTADTLTRLPITKSYGMLTPSRMFTWVVKIAADARSYLYATSIHSSEYLFGGKAVLDADGNAFILGETEAQSFPATAPPLLTRPLLPGNLSGYIAKFTSSGSLHKAVLTNLSTGVYHSDIALSRCNELVIAGSSSRKLVGTELNPRDPRRRDFPESHVLEPAYMICDSSMQKVHFAAIGHSDGLGYGHGYGAGYGGSYGWGSGGLGSGWDTDWLTLDPAGYIYNIHGWINRSPDRPLFYNTTRTVEDDDDINFSRHHYPVCQLLTCTVEVIDTIIVPLTTEPLVPPVFPITVTVSTDGAAADAYRVVGDLFLPAGINSLAGDSVVHIIFEPDTMQPDANIVRTVMVRTSREFQADTLPYVFIGYYTDSRDERSCPRPLTVCRTSSKVRYVSEYRPLPECEVVIHDSLLSYPPKPSCDPGTVPVQLILRHRGIASWNIGTVVLSLAGGMGLSFVIPGDSIQSGQELKPGDSLSWTWNVTVPRHDYASLARVSAYAYEESGQNLAYCRGELQIPANYARTCNITLPRSVTWDVATNRALTDPILATVQFDNGTDSSQGKVSARIDLTNARNLRLDASESIMKQPGVLQACSTLETSWILHATEPANAFESDTVTVIYSFEGDTASYFCKNRLQFIRLDQTVQCSIAAPDTLGVQPSDPTRLDTLLITAELRNTGTATADLRDAELVLDGAESFTALDPLFRTLAPLAQGAAVQLSWRILVTGSSVARKLSVLLNIRDQQGAMAAQCSSVLWVTPVPLSAECSVRIPGSISLDTSTGWYNPAVFPANVIIRNSTDTVLAGLTAVLDLADAPHLRLGSGDNPLRSLQPLAARDSVQVSWELEVASAPPSDSLQNIMVRMAQDQSSFTRYCNASLLLEGVEPVVKLRCVTSGHDSAYSDMHYEQIVPDPLQVIYSLINDGNAPASGCNVLLLIPAGWKLHSGTNPVDFGEIAPGETVTRSWLITPGATYRWENSISLTWQTTCDGSSIDSGCAHQIGFSTSDLWDIVITPLRLVFTAKRYAPLPPSQTVQLWTVNGSTVSWSAGATAPWLDVSPNGGNGPGIISLQPNTTQLQPGVFFAPLKFESIWKRPRTVQVIYEVMEPTTSIQAFQPDDDVLTVYPNPYSPGSGAPLYLQLPSNVSSQSGSVRIAVHDLLGRELFSRSVNQVEAVEDILRISLPGSIARSQLVIISVRSSSGTYFTPVMLTR